MASEAFTAVNEELRLRDEEAQQKALQKQRTLVVNTVKNDVKWAKATVEQMKGRITFIENKINSYKVAGSADNITDVSGTDDPEQKMLVNVMAGPSQPDIGTVTYNCAYVAKQEYAMHPVNDGSGDQGSQDPNDQGSQDPNGSGSQDPSGSGSQDPNGSGSQDQGGQGGSS
jgi:hypothetical protein